jgi:hypothetical protein
MDDLFQRPLGPNSIILNFPKKSLVKADIKQLSPKIRGVLMKTEGIQAISVIGGQNPPPLASFRVNSCYVLYVNLIPSNINSR